MVRFRPATAALGALAGLILIVTGCTTPSAPAAGPAKPAASTGPASPDSPVDATATAPVASQTPVVPTAPVTPPEPVVPAAPVTPVIPVAPPTPAPLPKPTPPPVVVAKPATIIGSEESSTMFDNFTAYITASDGQRVSAGRVGWNTALALSAGAHRLTVAFVRGVFSAQTVVQLQARSERAYELKFATDAQVFGKSSYCEFWIVDSATGETVLAPTRVPLTKIETGK